MQHSFTSSIFNKENFSNLLGFKKKTSASTNNSNNSAATATTQNENVAQPLTSRQPLSNIPQHIKFNHSGNIAANQTSTASSFALSAKVTTVQQSNTTTNTTATNAYQQPLQQQKYSTTNASNNNVKLSSYTSASSASGYLSARSRSSYDSMDGAIVEDNDFYDRRPSVTYTIEYQEDTSNFLVSTESKYLPSPSYMSQVQKDLSGSMRSVLIDWLVDVHSKFSLNPETLFLAVLYLDRYLSKVIVSKNNLQLVGVAALLVAAKYEEIYCPALKDFVGICANAFTQEETLEMEINILNTLGFNLTQCTINTFLQKYLLVNGSTGGGNGTPHGGVNSVVSSRLYFLSYYFAELCILDYQSLQYTPSQIALACVYLAQQMLVQSGAKTTCVKIKASAASVQGPLQLLMKAVEKDIASRDGSSKNKINAVRKKYSSKKKFEVAKFCAQFFANTTA